MCSESMMPSNHFILCCPLLLLPSIFPSIRVFSNESALHIKRPKYWRFSFSISPPSEYSGLISFKMDWLCLCVCTLSCSVVSDSLCPHGLPGSFVPGILQARILSGLPFPSPGYLPNPGIEPRSLPLQADSLPSVPPGKTNSRYWVGQEVHLGFSTRCYGKHETSLWSSG